MEKGSIRFSCSDPGLEAGFHWARAQALAYVQDDAPVGPWYEAALPGRDAFCMRDTSHQAAGAFFLGLASHNKNMLSRFARGIAESRDYCSFWEITREGVPAPVDYTSDRDFWYNLPANFDILDACWQMYCLAGDRDYLEDPAFTNFYDLTVTEYITRWDHDGDGIPDRANLGSCRGIPSYDEQKGMERMSTASDLIAAQYRGLLSYAKLRAMTGIDTTSYVEEAHRLGSILREQWWDSTNQRFYGAKSIDGDKLTSLGSPHLLAYFDAIEDKSQRKALLDQIHHTGEDGVIVELLSHYPEIFYRHGEPERGLHWLRRLTDPALPRRDYPEVSFAAVGAYVTGLMGLRADAATGSVQISPQLPADISFAELTGCPLFGGTIDLRCIPGETTLRNRTGAALRWGDTRIDPGETISK